MNIIYRETSYIDHGMTGRSIFRTTPHSSLMESLDNKYKKIPLKSNSQNLNFKGKNKVAAVIRQVEISEAIEKYGSELGSSPKKYIEGIIGRLTSIENPWITITGKKLNFEEDKFITNLSRAILDPIIHFPLDITNSTLNLLKKIPAFKNSKTIDRILGKGPLKNRSQFLEDFSNAMGLQNYFKILGNEEFKDGQIFREAQKRLSENISNYSTKAERSFTRAVTGLIPAFFLANDAYNLSIYLNDNKDLAKKEKKRRFYQEIARIAITVASTFAVLGMFAKKSNARPESATILVSALTFCSEILGRMFTGVPFYPIGEKQAKKLAKLQNKNDYKGINSEQNKKDKTDKNQPQANSTNSSKKKNKSDSNFALKLMGAMVLVGFGSEMLVRHVRPVKNILSRMKNRYGEYFTKDFTIERKEFDKLMQTLKEKGFGEMAENFEEMVDQILKQGNLTAKETNLLNEEIERRVTAELNKGERVLITKKIEDKENKIRDRIDEQSRHKILEEIGLADKNNETINICNFTNKPKDIIVNQILGLPVKLAKEIFMMPYKYIVKPLIDLPREGAGVFKPKDKSLTKSQMLKNIIEYLRKNKDIENPNFENELNKIMFDSFDNVNKSNFSNAELSGSAKTAVSTVTSLFLILDNYNRVMIDSQGEDKQLAKQKAKERTIQRIVRIAYGACIINLFNGIFAKQFNASLLGAQAVNTANTFVIETLERTSVGLPLHEATRKEIIEKDNANLNAKGLKGFYFKLMSKLTGKKSISEMRADKN